MLSCDVIQGPSHGHMTNTCFMPGPDNLLLDKALVISRTNRQFEAAIRNIVSFIIDTIVDPLKEILSDRYELSRLRRIILFNASTCFLYIYLYCDDRSSPIALSGRTVLVIIVTEPSSLHPHSVL